MAVNDVSRRSFFGAAAGIGGALANAQDISEATSNGGNARRREAYRIRVEAARRQRDSAQVQHPTNGDEQQFTNKIGNFSKGLPHNDLGEVDVNAFQVFTNALNSDSMQTALEKVPMGMSDATRQRKLVNPCAGVCFELAGADSHQLTMRAAPSVASAEIAGEAVEMYWLALSRDVSFTAYNSDPTISAAAADLTKLSDFRGPKSNGAVTPGTIFRGITTGDVTGPYVSQFLLKPIPFGAQYVEQKMRTVASGVDFMTRYADWLAVQNGAKPDAKMQSDPSLRYIRNGRDLAEWVHIDVLYQAYFNAMLIMLQSPDPTDTVTGGGMGVPLNPGNPYLESQVQEGFGTFGAPAIATAVAENAARALKAVWYQKWFVHRRLRPEAYGGLVHNVATSKAKYPIHQDVLNSAAAARVNQKNGSFLLPMAFPEGSPLHPSYGAGHATVAGASITILKALFDENYVIPNPVVASADGLSLVPYTGPDANRLTVGGELNKLAANIGIGRNFGGVHWRSDYAESVKLGEALAISVLRDQALTYAEDFTGAVFTRLDGTKIRV